MISIAYLLFVGTGIWGINVPVGWGFAIINFVWWIGIGHAGTLISAILLLLQADMAHVDQPLRRSDDAVRGRLRGDIPDPAHWAGPGSRLLAVPVSEHDGRVAAVPQPAHLGRVRGLDLRDRLAAVLVRRTDSRSRDAARSIGIAGRPRHLRRARDGMARLGAPLASLRDGVSAARGTRDAARRLGAHDRELRLRRVGRFPAGTPRSSRRTSWPAPSIRASRWC